MIVDDVEAFIKYLDGVSLQLAEWLDLDGHSSYPKRASRQKSGKIQPKTPRATRINQNPSAPKRHYKTVEQTADTSTRGSTRGRRRTTVDNRRNELQLFQPLCNDNAIQSQLTSQQGQQEPAKSPQRIEDQNCSANRHTDKLNGRSRSKQALGGQLSIAVMGEEVALEHTNSISPMESNANNYNSSIQSNYYQPQRSHLDSYQILDEFSGHENGGGHMISQHQPPVGHSNILMHNQHPQHQTQRHTMAPVEGLEDSSLAVSECYSLHAHRQQDLQVHSHQETNNQNHHQHEQLDQSNLQPQHHGHHQVHYHQLDHQWHPHQADNSLHLGAMNVTNSLDQVVAMSPVPDQSLEHVQFTTSIYHHGYYNLQHDQLDSFHHINDEYHVGRMTSPPMNQIHRIQLGQVEEAQQQQSSNSRNQLSHHHMDPSGQVSTTSLDMNATGSGAAKNSYGSQPYQQQQQIHHHNHQEQMRNEIQIHDNSNEVYTTHRHQQQSTHLSLGNQQSHQQHHQMLPIIGSLEPSAVIIQDINLASASASWPSPEDLYSI